MPIQVLVVDPEPDKGLALRAQFEALECETRRVGSVEEAARLVSDARPDALVVTLDDTTARFVRAVRARLAAMPVLALVPPDYPVDDALAAGVTALLPMPFAAVDLFEAATELLAAVRP